MSREQYHLNVHPAQGTRCTAPPAVPLPGYDLWLTFIKHVHVIPAPLDVDHFVKALSDTLLQFPNVAGRLHVEHGNWSIMLTDSPIPVEVEISPNTTLHFKDSWVVQDDSRLRRLLNLPVPGSSLINGDGALLRFKLTLTQSETAIGVSWHHILGDASALKTFMGHLSQTYQGLPTSAPRLTFSKYVFPTPSQEDIDRLLPSIPHLRRTYPASEIGSMYAKMNQNMAPINFHIPLGKLRQVQSRIQESVGNSNLRLSVHDCLIAHVVTILNRCLSTPIRFVTHAASYRTVDAPFVESHEAGNAIHIIPTSLNERDAQNVEGIAVALRRSILKWRDPDLLARWLAVASHSMLEAANSDRSMFFAATSGLLSVNSQVSLDWQSTHFEYPRRARFHTAGCNERYLRVFVSNPSPTASDLDNAIEISLGVPELVRSAVLDMLTQEFGSPSGSVSG